MIMAPRKIFLGFLVGLTACGSSSSKLGSGDASDGRSKASVDAGTHGDGRTDHASPPMDAHKSDRTSAPSDTGAADGARRDAEGGSSVADAGADATVPQVAEVFANNGDTLFRVNLDAGALSIVGKFTGCTDGIQDVALDSKSNMYATSGYHIWRVDRTTAACVGDAAVASDAGLLPVAITFLPKDDAGVEPLVGFTSTRYVRVDLSTGGITPLGVLPAGYSLTGDSVAVKGGPTYISLGGNGCADCLAELDTSDANLTTLFGSLGYPKVNGLAFWGGAVYGFTGPGQVLKVTFPDGGLHVTSLPINDAGYGFAGAGSTTSAPRYSVL